MRQLPPGRPSREHLELIYRELKDQLTLQLADLEALDRRATVVLAPVGVLIGFALNSAKELTVAPSSRAAFALGLVTLVTALLSGIAALWPRHVVVAPRPTRLFPAYVAITTEDMLARECTAVVDAFERNARTRRAKIPFLYGEFVMLVMGTIALAAAYALQSADILR